MMMLVVDIVKGIQTQTAECLIIGEILCNKMIVVLNKIDLIEEKKRPVAIEKVSFYIACLFVELRGIPHILRGLWNRIDCAVFLLLFYYSLGYFKVNLFSHNGTALFNGSLSFLCYMFNAKVNRYFAHCFISYRNQSFNVQYKSNEWFLYEMHFWDEMGWFRWVPKSR